MNSRKLALVGFCLLGINAWGTNAEAQDIMPRDNGIFSYHTSPRYRESESHPLRTLAYVLHPIGWVMREGFYRPFSSFAGSTRFTRSFFGYREPFDYREPECFFDSDKVPNCKDVSPFNSIGKNDADTEGESKDGALNSERQVYFPDIAFDFNKHTLNQLGKARVRQVAQLLSTVPNLKVVVEGHTDYIGSDEYNLKLGQRRADTVMKELTDLGTDAARLSPVSLGEGKPLFTEEEDWARAANRRVQFSVNTGTPAAETAAPVKAAAELPPAK